MGRVRAPLLLATCVTAIVVSASLASASPTSFSPHELTISLEGPGEPGVETPVAGLRAHHESTELGAGSTGGSDPTSWLITVDGYSICGSCPSPGTPYLVREGGSEVEARVLSERAGLRAVMGPQGIEIRILP